MLSRSEGIQMVSSSDDDPPATGSAGAAEDTSTTPATSTPPAIISNEPTLPVTTTAEKVKRLGVVAVAVLGGGILLDLAFTDANPFFQDPNKPKVNQGLVKYGAVVSTAVSSSEANSPKLSRLLGAGDGPSPPAATNPSGGQ